MSELITAALVKKGADAAEEAAKSFLRSLLGPATQEAGLILQDKVRLYRFRNQVKTLGKAQEMLGSVGVLPSQVPLRVLLPLLDGAALEDDNNLSAKWAALLANAAHPALHKRVHPTFIRAMSELSPEDAVVLDALWASEVRISEHYPEDLQNRTGLGREELEFVTENLTRLGLCSLRGGVMLRDGSGRIEGERGLGLSLFGRRFLAACQPPVDLPLREDASPSRAPNPGPQADV